VGVWSQNYFPDFSSQKVDDFLKKVRPHFLQTKSFDFLVSELWQNFPILRGRKSQTSWPNYLNTAAATSLHDQIIWTLLQLHPCIVAAILIYIRHICKTGIMSAALFWRKMKMNQIGRNCWNCFLSLHVFSQYNGRRKLILQNDIIFKIIIQNLWSRYHQIEACEVFYLLRWPESQRASTFS
jgi:hypothetical protein